MADIVIQVPADHQIVLGPEDEIVEVITPVVETVVEIGPPETVVEVGGPERTVVIGGDDEIIEIPGVPRGPVGATGPTGPPGPPGTAEEQVPYDIETDLSTPGVVYVGQALPGTATSQALWRVKRITESVGGTSIDWADGDAEFDNAWDDRDTLTYGP